MGAEHLKGIRGTWGDWLSGKRVALAVTASVSAYRAPDVARLLMRYGADVVPVMTEEAASMLSPEVMRWATGNDPVVEPTGRIEYVELTEGSGRVDAVVVTPATQNVLAKLCAGISDDAVTLLLSCALGNGIPIVAAPAMHESMFRSPVVRELTERLRSLGVTVVGPRTEEGKAKLAEPEDVLDATIYATSPKPLRGAKYLVTAGPTREHIDSVRFITNASSGKMGVEVARALRRLGAEVTLVHGPMQARPPLDVGTVRVTSAREMLEACLKEARGARGFFAAAAVSDYEPVERFVGKVDSRASGVLELRLRATPKVVAEVRRAHPEVDLVVFRAIHGTTGDPAELASPYIELNPVMVAINDVSREDVGFGKDLNELVVVARSGLIERIGPARKSVVARTLVGLYLREVGTSEPG
ncbi:MAG: bifunctional phosphopantothenoylcysteine decarboxylase/phosphopantothenate--cysteine ligase CoaBC [Aigarchaeota archaeon]|nr:bifunctional phosphopantothenoylcysteine decarboxylase/phosphopantothenate--cysteine ligase CoaBC [Aigarchaeota archaeon]MCX8203494.1 bifunctional phosphopantothenoylcysteine decarboxylase/phosphopantothenate--cysteine ligase CoaBC [Nitrososphaeria archaeon]MDW8043885.1 bifunctional phosphopantothenoylcysteine decarboxylase/phosphopantothenate--cysteine ligase CoaBC [Nitrososphaerota archaeon]